MSVDFVNDQFVGWTVSDSAAPTTPTGLETEQGLHVGETLSAVTQAALTDTTGLTFFELFGEPSLRVGEGAGAGQGISGTFSGRNPTDILNQLEASTQPWGECYVIE